MVEVVGGWVSTPPHEANVTPPSSSIRIPSLRVGDPVWSRAPSGGCHVRKLSCDAQGDSSPLPKRCSSTYLLQLCALCGPHWSSMKPAMSFVLKWVSPVATPHFGCVAGVLGLRYQLKQLVLYLPSFAREPWFPDKAKAGIEFCCIVFVLS